MRVFTYAIGHNVDTHPRTSLETPQGTIQARLVFGCGLLIYAKLLIRHSDPPRSRRSSSRVRSQTRSPGKLAAEELIGGPFSSIVSLLLPRASFFRHEQRGSFPEALCPTRFSAGILGRRISSRAGSGHHRRRW